MLVEFKEAVINSKPERVDRENGIIYGVALLGESSPNTASRRAKQRVYPRALREALVPKFEGLPVYFDHGAEDKPRNFREQAGKVINSRFNSDRNQNIGDIKCKKSHTNFELLMESAESFSENFGMSLSGGGPVRYEGDSEIVIDIPVRKSFDVVTEPATVTSLFESRQAMTIKLKDLFAELVKKDATKAPASRALAILKESVGAIELEAKGSDEEQLGMAFETMRNATLKESMDKKAKLLAIQEILNAEDGEETPKPDEDKEPKAITAQEAKQLRDELRGLNAKLEEQNRQNLITAVALEEGIQLSEATESIKAQLAKATTRQQVSEILAAVPRSRRGDFRSAVFSESRGSANDSVESLTDYRRKPSK